jgi:hypothetical protein
MLLRKTQVPTSRASSCSSPSKKLLGLCDQKWKLLVTSACKINLSTDPCLWVLEKDPSRNLCRRMYKHFLSQEGWRGKRNFGSAGGHRPPSPGSVRRGVQAPVIVAFLDDLEKHRGLSVRSESAPHRAPFLRRYAAFEAPAHWPRSSVCAIPSKRFTRNLVQLVTRTEVDVLLTALDQHMWAGRRDHPFLLLAVQTGLHLSR